MRFGITLLAALALAAAGCEEEDRTPRWQVVMEDLPGALLRVWGTSASDVWVVGADADGRGPLVFHFDGQRFSRLDTGAQGSLWWVEAVGPDDVRLVGDGGLILSYQPSTGRFTRRPTVTTATLFGVWGERATDVWYVGGAPAATTGVILRDDGERITSLEAPPATTSSAALFKVHGLPNGEVWMVGQRGRALVYDGANLHDRRAATPLPLISLHGTDPAGLYAVGGVSGGVILRNEGGVWIDETPRGLPMMSGVWATGRDEAYAAGFNGNLWRRTGGAWVEVAPAPPTFEDFHAVWVDPEGGLWAAGGRLAADPPRDGVLTYYGPPLPKDALPR